MPWLTPDDLGDGEICRPLFIPDTSDWQAIVSGAILELAREWNWEKAGTLTPAQCAAAMQEMMQRYYDDACSPCTLPDGGRFIRLSLTGHFEELSGDEWIEPEGDYAIPPTPARTGGTPEELRCLAAANAANVLRQLYEQTTDLFNEGISTGEAALELGLLITAFIAPPVGLGAMAIYAMARIAFGEFFAFMDFLTEDVWGTKFDDAIECMLYECSFENEGVVEFDMTCFTRALGDNTNPFDLSLTEFRLLAQVSYLLSIIGVDGLNLAGATTAITEADCSACDPVWCYSFNFLATDGGWEYVTSIGAYNWSPAPSWENGVGWKRGVISPNAQPNVRGGSTYIEIAFDARQVTSVRMEFDKTPGQCIGASDCYHSRMFDQSGNFFNVANTTTQPNPSVSEWAGLRTMSMLRVAQGSGHCNNGCALTGQAVIRKIIVRGRGENPFGVSNC